MNRNEKFIKIDRFDNVIESTGAQRSYGEFLVSIPGNDYPFNVRVKGFGFLKNSNAVHVYDTQSFEKVAELPAKSPSGIFMTARAHRIGL